MRGPATFLQHWTRSRPPRIARQRYHNIADIGPIEEQTLPRYDQKRYYPVKIGDIFKNRYRVIAKLGYGAQSTVWLAQDERSKQYTSLKVCVQDDTRMSPTVNEVKMLQRLAKVAQGNDHPGILSTRLARDIFEVSGPTGRHYCIATDAQGNSLRTLQESFTDAKLPKLLVRSTIHRLFLALNWLHADCGVIHTDLSPANVLMETEDETIFKDIEDQESRDPSVPILSDRAPVYQSRSTMLELSGVPVLTDFGKMKVGEQTDASWWMSDLYRAPEVLLKLPWSAHVDLWSVGIMTLELLEGRNLFDPIDRANSQYVLPLALAQYIGYLGLPPLEVIKQSPLFLTYFDSDGNWTSETPIPKTSLEDFVTTIPPGEEKELFLRFIRKMLTWDPKSREESADIVLDKWLMKPNDEMM
ncbi:MAG: hypothetical protein M1821_007969 [Bathelium mastoideum]|nr:MAG: hypothetical protein M1821_007969 [Bathelium mastoideum]